jgi:hypothetical protein
MKDPIFTLDGELWDRNELTQKAIQDSFYYGYLAKACFSSSAVSQLLDSPLEYLNKINLPTESDALAQGYLFHASILEQDKFNECLFLDVSRKSNKEYVSAKAERWDVFTVKDRDIALRMRDRFYSCDEARELIENSNFEVPMVNTLNVGGTDYPFRAKADVLGEYLIDLKSTAKITRSFYNKNGELVEYNSFKNSANKYNYDSQCYIYCNLFGKSYKDFKYIVIDKSPKNEIGIFEVGEEFYYSGEQKVEYAIKVYENYIKNEYDLENYIIKGTL